jgi:uridine phosphorylase
LTAYLRPTAPIAADVLLPADPGLAMALAQRLTAKPLMANHNHGLWGYSGRTEAGGELTVQATGIGAPSAAAVLAELQALGARRLIRIGRCAALDPGLGAGDVVVAASALGADGTTAALGAQRAHPDRGLTAALQRSAGAAAAAVAVVSFDLGGGAPAALRERWTAAGIAAIDLETAALFALGERLGLALAAGLVVGETAAGDGDEAAVDAALLALGEAARDALAVPVSPGRAGAAARAR